MASVIDQINQHIDQYKAMDRDVIYVRQVNRTLAARMFSRIFTQGLGVGGNPGCEIDDRIAVVSPHVFDKEQPRAFSSPGFVQYLKSRDISELALTGLDGCFCVNATAKDALKRSLGVELIDAAIATSFPKRWLRLIQTLLAKGATLV
jgi:nicotinamidase-related amidase